MKPESISVTDKMMLVFVFVAGLVAVAIPRAHAQTFSVVHSFSGGSDGGNPVNGFSANTVGELFGTASSGGAYGNGVVYKMTVKGAETVLHSFSGGTDGAGPNAELISSTYGYYGTTTAGGAFGNGTVFLVNGTKETVLYSFAGGTNGADPQAGLVLDPAGNLYGTTSAGGTNGNGTVFKLAPPLTKPGTWTETILYSFGGGTDGVTPVGGVSFDASGNLYGTTSAGGAYGYGTIFQLVPGTVWTENILHSFQDGDDGAVPYADLISDSSGNFYGAATEGGNGGGGTIFELTPAGGSWTFSVLYSVPGWGISGSYRKVVLDASGNLYGTTHCDGNYNAGTVYELTPAGGSWTYSVLYTFTGGTDGLYSFSNLVVRGGKVYGTTKYGGAHGNGVVFAVTP
ncbi:MAG: choice-of-anchor tandem repeat GloVer-containing protein [Candidatus Sulfotelmatobacter sp.]